MAGVKGKSGRKPNERPVKAVLSTLLDEIDPATERTRLWKICEKMVKEAENGEQWAVKELFDRLEGKAVQAHSGEGGGPIETITKILLVAPDGDGAG